MCVRRRKQGQEGNRLTARLADTAPDLNPIMVFVMGLFAAATMANDRVSQTNGASANDLPSACDSPIGFQVALRCRKCDKDNRTNALGPALAKVMTPEGPFASSKESTGKEYLISDPPAGVDRGPAIGRSIVSKMGTSPWPLGQNKNSESLAHHSHNR